MYVVCMHNTHLVNIFTLSSASCPISWKGAREKHEACRALALTIIVFNKHLFFIFLAKSLYLSSVVYFVDKYFYRYMDILAVLQDAVCHLPWAISPYQTDQE